MSRLNNNSKPEQTKVESQFSSPSKVNNQPLEKKDIKNFHSQNEEAKKQMTSFLLSQMTPEEKIGQLVMPSTHDEQDLMPNELTKKLIQKYKVGSVIIYGSSDSSSLAEYNNQLQKWAYETRLPIPLFTTTDLEYGVAQHVTDGTAFPRQMGLGATWQPALAEKAASIIAKEARAIGFNWNYSPVADVNTNPSNPVIGVRSFSEQTSLVSKMAEAMVLGHQSNRVMATAKHFPGHGDTEVDSHLGLAKVTYSKETLASVHLPPFQRTIDAGVDSIMTAHVIIEAIDPDLPATLSKKVLTGLLREELGFNGIIVTDAMSMHAIQKHFGAGQAAVMAVQAGADIVMATGSFDEQIETYESLLTAYKTGALSHERIHHSLERILMKKMDYQLFADRYTSPSEAKQVTNEPSHKQAAREIANQSITLLRNDGALPFSNQASETTLVVGPIIYSKDTHVLNIAKSIERHTSGTVTTCLTNTDNPTEEEIKHALNQAQNVDRIIVATFSSSSLPEGQRKLVNALVKLDKPVVAISLGLPYDIKHFPQVNAYLATYALDRWGSPIDSSILKAVDVLFGEQPGGKLSVSIDGQYPLQFGLQYNQ